jgi:hypothetical protein
MTIRNLTIFAAVFILCACTQERMSSTQQKSTMLDQTGVMSGSSSTGETSGQVVQTPASSGSVVQTTGTSSTISGSVPIDLVCSDDGSHSSTNFQAAVAAQDSIEIEVNGSVCSTDPATITKLFESSAATRAIALSAVQQICPSVVPASGAVTLSFLINGKVQSSASSAAPASCGHGKNCQSGPQSLTILWAQRTASGNNPKSGTDLIDTLTSGVNKYCTETSSPLVIRLPQNPQAPQALNLSPQHSVLFDLLGSNNAHQKVLINWFTNLDYRLLALPNQNGEVRGIDQLFGNNTTGPDGETAANGYAALAKYDVNQDGRIDRHDPMFAQLRVWLDSNYDGVAQNSELVSLDSVGISYIDLDYSRSHPETDAYGNQIKMKSVAGLADQSMALVFDLWFAYSP